MNLALLFLLHYVVLAICTIGCVTHMTSCLIVCFVLEAILQYTLGNVWYDIP